MGITARTEYAIYEKIVHLSEFLSTFAKKKFK